MSDSEAPRTAPMPVTAFGWVRRDDISTKNADVWEAPDGRRRATPKGVQPEIVTIWPGYRMIKWRLGRAANP